MPRCCGKYKIRRFSSRGATLVLVWNLCITAAVSAFGGSFSTVQTVLDKTFPDGDISPTIILGVTLIAVFFVVGPLIGWFADNRYGNFSVFKGGAVGLFVFSVLNCLIIVYTSTLGDSFVSYPVLLVTLIILYFFAVCCVVAIFTVLLQLGLDQLPYSSSESITSYINWSFFCFLSGLWFGRFTILTIGECTAQKYATAILALVPVGFTSVVLCSDFIFSNQWVIKDNVSAQSLKNIYRVLKFAATHKTPINRSVLTYWEEDIPSRIDLAKQRYGGPYTTEQVEDVKTFLKLLIVFLPLTFTASALISHLGTGIGEKNVHSLITLNQVCFSEMIYFVTYSPTWCAMMLTPIYEFVIYPIVQHKLPSMLKRIGIASLFVILINIAHVCWIVATLYANVERYTDWFFSAKNIVVLCIFRSILSTVYEFVCAQSPHSKRALIIGYTTAIVIFSIIGSGAISVLPQHFSDKGPIIRAGISSTFAVIGFLLHCIFAYKYKMRVREDIDNPQGWAEEAYRRYFDQRDAYYRRYYRRLASTY